MRSSGCNLIKTGLLVVGDAADEESTASVPNLVFR
jgi:hypothetical protein